MTSTHMAATGIAVTPVELGAKHIRWGLGLFVFGLVIGFVPLVHYMHGSFEEVHEAFLKNVTLWWGCAFTLAVYVAQVGSLAMIAIGLCYVVFARDGAMTSVTDAERMAPVRERAGFLRNLRPDLPATTPSPRSGRTSTTPRLLPERSPDLGCRASVSQFMSPASCARTEA